MAYRNNVLPPFNMPDHPPMDWTIDEGLYARFLLFKQECEIILNSDLAPYDDNGKKNYILRWAASGGIEIYNRWNIKDTPQDILATYWEKWED